MLGFRIIHKLEPVPDNFSVFVVYPSIAVISIEPDFEIQSTPDECAILVLVNRALVAFNEQRIGHALHIRESGRTYSVFQLQNIPNDQTFFDFCELY